MTNLIPAVLWNDPPDVDAPPQPQPPESKPLGELKRRGANEPTELLRTGFLCRGGGLLICGPTGIGKSSLAVQMMLCWGIGQECFGIAPTAPLRSLLIQAENDDGDLAEMRDGVIDGLNLPPEQAQAALASVTVSLEDARTGLAFTTGTLAPLLDKHRPDLVWIDPALAYLGGEASAQKDVGGFLRNMLNPLLHQYECGGVIISHTNKPPSGREKPNWTAGDFAYLGTGSAEWANWARGVLALRSLGSHEVFELRAGKRGARLGWQDKTGARCYIRHLAHAERGIFWRDAAEDELPQTGRPKQHDARELLELLPDEGLSASEWQKLAKAEVGFSEAAFHRERRALEKGKRILRSRSSGKWQPLVDV